jgi:hypothetical protein
MTDFSRGAAYVEMICTRGLPTPGSPDPRTCTNRFYAFAIRFVWIAKPEKQIEGLHLIISRQQRIPQNRLHRNYKKGIGNFTKTRATASKSIINEVAKAAKTSAHAIWSLVLGILSLLCFGFLSEHVALMIDGTQDHVKITAIDNSGKCTRGSQYVVSLPESVNDGWQ